MQIPLPEPPDVPIEKVDKYRWAYVVMVFSILLFFFVGAYILATKEIHTNCEDEKVRLRVELEVYKKENRELLTANYKVSLLLRSIDSLTRIHIDEKDVKQTVENNKHLKQ